MKKLLVFILLCLLSTLLIEAQNLPDKFVGNWINQKTSNWEYGLFEKFVIYQNDFWDYQSVMTDKKGNTEVTLIKGNESITLKLKDGKDSLLSVQLGNGKAASFIKMKKVYPDYPKKDKAFFNKPTFGQDSATIIGYYRNRDKVPQQFAARLLNSPFSVAISSVISGDEEKYMADFDSLGRFKITFPIMNMQELFVDWGRLSLHMFMEAGDTISMFTDLVDFIPLEKDGSYESYLVRPKQLLFMGKNARLNNELYTYKKPRFSSDRNISANGTDMEYLAHCDSISRERINVLNNHINEHPNISTKFQVFLTERERYELLFDLMQHRFDAQRRKGKPNMDSAYVSFVGKKAVLDQEWMYTGLREFRSFLRDWIGYHESIRGNTNINLTFKDITAYVRKNRTVSSDTLDLLDQLVVMGAEFEKTEPEKRAALQEKYKPLLEKVQGLSPLFNEVGTEMVAALPKPINVPDSLLKNETLRRLWDAHSFYQTMDQNHLPLKPEQLKSMRETVVIPSLVAQLEKMNHFYENVAKTGMTYAASLKSTEHLKEYKDAKILFDELIQPYKGKVIYVDFWGTWCGPCKENMKLVGALKEKLKGQKVVFMYFANRSPEDSWKNIIKEMDLTGENVVHYRLPEEQEAIIERMFSVNKFPTYLLINKEGKVVNTDAKSPMNKEETLNQIAELL